MPERVDGAKTGYRYAPPGHRRLRSEFGDDDVNSLSDGGDVLGLLIGNRHAELVLQGHEQFNHAK